MDAGEEQHCDMKHDGINAPKWKFWKRKRYVIALMSFLGTANLYTLRGNVSVAMPAMATDNATETSDPGSQDAEFIWSNQVQGLILGAFFYGYITTQVLGGWLAEHVGGTRLVGASVAITSVLTILTPLVARAGPYWFVAVRVLEGIFSGVSYPSFHQMWSRWAPRLERSQLATFTYSGSQIGAVVVMGLSGVLAEQIGWPSIFYVFGGIGLVWVLGWWLLVERSPEFDKRIHPFELKYIQQSLKENLESDNKSRTYPWLSIALSLPVWAIAVANFCQNWFFYTMLTQLPLFMKDTMDGFDLEQIGFLSALPYLMQMLTMLITGVCTDVLLTRKLLTTTQARKCFYCIASSILAVMLLVTTFQDTPAATVSCLIVASGLAGVSLAGYLANHLDIASQYAGVLMGIGNTAGTLPGIISPNLSGYIVQNHTRSEWKIVFYIASSISLGGAIFYGLFASGERQAWATTECEEPEIEVSSKSLQ